MSKTLFVTGGAGFAGHHFLEHILKNTDWDMICPVSFRHKGDSHRISHLQNNPRITWMPHDLTCPISHRLAGKYEKKIFAIVNYASQSHVDRSIVDPVPFVENNIKLILNVLEFSRLVMPDKFLQVSTDEVYGPSYDKTGHKEWSTILPSNPYAGSKAAQEAIAISYWRTYGVPLIITNTMNLIAERQDKEKFLPTLISKIANEKTVTIHGTKEFIGSRKYLHCRNQSDAILFLLKNKTPTKYEHSLIIQKPDRFNIVGDELLNNLQLAKMVSDIIGKTLKYELVDFHSCRPGHDAVYQLDGSLMKSIGWKAPLDFRSSLKKTIEWSLSHPEWLR